MLYIYYSVQQCCSHIDTHGHTNVHILAFIGHICGCSAAQLVLISRRAGVCVSCRTPPILCVCVCVLPNESHSLNHAIWSWQWWRWWLNAHRLPALKSPSLSLRIHIQGLPKWLFSLSFSLTHTHTPQFFIYLSRDLLRPLWLITVTWQQFSKTKVNSPTEPKRAALLYLTSWLCFFRWICSWYIL